MIIKTLLGIAIAAMLTGGASVATHQVLQNSSEVTIQDEIIPSSAESDITTETDFNINFVSSTGL